MAQGCSSLAVASTARQEAAAEDLFPEIDGGSAAIRQLKLHMLRVAQDPDISVLIVGESGTGKERVARAIHRLSPRSHRPFVVVDCASLSSSLVEDELFGHVKGAFTGAVRDRLGPFERASGGTVLLDEVGDLTLDLQMKLLRALQARTVQRLGGRDETSFDVRVIAATNVDLELSRSRGCFRDDLYYRLAVYGIRVPPLRKRGAADVKALTTALLTRFAARRRRPVPAVGGDALEALIHHGWPGNVRELENTLECMMVAAGSTSPLTTAHLPESFGIGGGWARGRVQRQSAPSEVELVAALERNGGRPGPAAADLGLSRHQLYRLVKRHGLRGSAAGR